MVLNSLQQNFRFSQGPAGTSNTHQHPPTIVRHGKVDAAVNSAKRFLRKSAAVTRLPGVSCWAQYSITRHWEQSNSETHEQEDEDSSSHNWQSAGAKEPQHKPWERQNERCAKKASSFFLQYWYSWLIAVSTLREGFETLWESNHIHSGAKGMEERGGHGKT